MAFYSWQTQQDPGKQKAHSEFPALIYASLHHIIETIDDLTFHTAVVYFGRNFRVLVMHK